MSLNKNLPAFLVLGLATLMLAVGFSCSGCSSVETDPDRIVLDWAEDPWDPPVTAVLDAMQAQGLYVADARRILGTYSNEGTIPVTEMEPVLELFRAARQPEVTLDPRHELWVDARIVQLENLLDTRGAR